LCLAPLKPQISLTKDTILPNCPYLQCNPLLLTILNPNTAWENPQVATCIYEIGVSISRFDLIGRLKIHTGDPSQSFSASSTNLNIPTPEEGVGEKPLNNPEKVHVTVVNT
jgi:hypothetical protein